MDKKIREHIAELLKAGEEIPAEYEEDLFPTTKKEYELVYAGKERKEKILSDTMSVPFQAIKHFGEVKDGEWSNKLIFGDNLQALKHLLKLKKEGKLKNADGTDGVRLVYIDPPFGTGDQYDASGDVPAYSAKLQGAMFLEYLRKRLILLKEILSEDGSIFLRMDYHFGHYVKIIMDEIFDKNNFMNDIIINRTKAKQPPETYFTPQTDSLFFFKIGDVNIFNRVTKERLNPEWFPLLHFPRADERPRVIKGKTFYPPKNRRWALSQERIDVFEKNNKTRINPDLEYIDCNGKKIKGMPELFYDEDIIRSDWLDIPGYGQSTHYPTENSEPLLERVIKSSSNPGDLVLDCFAGSGTTGAVAEKLGRRWIMCDCGKLAIYTITKRMLNLKKEIGNKGADLKHKPFVLYNAGLYYDGKLLEHMQKDEYKDFVLELFGCQKRDHEINGLDFQGTLNNHSVMIFDKEHYLTHEFIDQLDKTIGKSIKSECFIIAPAGIVGFGEDYIKKGDRRYTVLRIPNSIIAYIRDKNFTRLEQPRTSEDVNQTIDSVGFDFIYPPKVKSKYSFSKPKGKLTDAEYLIEIEKFEPVQLGSKVVELNDPKAESLAMVMIDLDYDGDTFQMDKYWFGSDITKSNFRISFDDKIGEKVMVIYLDIFGNEKKEILNKNDFDRI